MRTELLHIAQIDRYLFNRMPAEEREAFRIRLLIEPDLFEAVERQREAYRLVRAYGRRRLRAELQTINRQLMARPSFRARLLAIFRR